MATLANVTVSRPGRLIREDRQGVHAQREHEHLISATGFRRPFGAPHWLWADNLIPFAALYQTPTGDDRQRMLDAL
jgi:hypothetical protein